jgi:hypothetical protein
MKTGSTTAPPVVFARARRDGRALLLATMSVLLAGGASVRGDDWPQWLGPRRDSHWRETGIIRSFSSNGPTGPWRAGGCSSWTGS